MDVEDVEDGALVAEHAGTTATTTRLEIARGPETVFLSGELDLSTADGLHRELISDAERTGGVLRLDMSAVTFVDSWGLRELIAASRSTVVQVVNPSPFVETLLFVTGVEDLFGVS